MSDKSKILKYFSRKDFDEEIHIFDDLLRRAVEIVLMKNSDDLDRYVELNSNRYWNAILKLNQSDRENGIVPIFNIEDELLKKVSWFMRSTDKIEKKKLYLLRARTSILRTIDNLSDRHYEALGCVTCKLLGAQKVLLTPPGNEAGIDFVAAINFAEKSHYFFGINGPLRIIGQCKKYNSAVQVNAIKEFNATLIDVYSLTEKMRKVLPDWFLTSKGPIIGWFIGHEGFQSGALSRARNYGIVTSDSRDVAEVISLSRKHFPLLTYQERALGIISKISEVIKSREENMALW